MARRKYDYDLIKKLYFEEAGKGARDYRQTITTRYKLEKGETIPAGSLSTYITQIRQEERQSVTEYVDEKTHYSERYIEIGTSELLDPDDIVRLHGRNPETFELATDGSTRSKIGSNNEQGYLINSYSKATFKPRQFKLTKDIALDMMEGIFKQREPIVIPSLKRKGKGLLLIPLKDMHFGLNSYDDYKAHQAEIYSYITSREWEEIIFIIGSDLFQTNDSYGRTVLGTQVGFKVNLNQHANWALNFYEILLEASVSHSQRVKVYYEEGNHDKDVSLLFVTALSWLYPSIDFIIEENKPYQEINFHNVWIGTHHGDVKNKPKQVAETFVKYFGLSIAKAKYKEILIGHLHHLFSEQHMNILVQGLSTATKESDYDMRMGFGYGHKAFVIRVYTENGLKTPILIDGDGYEDIS